MSLASNASLEDQIAYWKRKYKRLCCVSIDNVSGEPTWNPDTDSNDNEVAYDPDTNIFYFWFDGAWHSIDVADSGRAYQDILHYQKTSYRDGDEGYRLSNNLMDLGNPSNPTFMQMIDCTDATPFDTLVFDNHYGNKNRFTDTDGLQVYGDGIIIDHLTKRMYKQITNAAIDWQESVDLAEASTFGGFSDWHLVTSSEIYSLWNNTNLSLTVAGNSLGTGLWTSTTISDATTRAVQFNASTNTITSILRQPLKTAALANPLSVRIFDEADL
jgi:hypothetical protein